jgi:hypothetical protein
MSSRVKERSTGVAFPTRSQEYLRESATQHKKDLDDEGEIGMPFFERRSDLASAGIFFNPVPFEVSENRSGESA